MSANLEIALEGGKILRHTFKSTAQAEAWKKNRLKDRDFKKQVLSAEVRTVPGTEAGDETYPLDAVVWRVWLRVDTVSRRRVLRIDEEDYELHLGPVITLAKKDGECRELRQQAGADGMFRWACNCEDFLYRRAKVKAHCKHLIAADMTGIISLG